MSENDDKYFTGSCGEPSKVWWNLFWRLYYQFTVEFRGERILKIVLYLAKLYGQDHSDSFLTHSHSGPGFVSPCSVSINKKFQFYTAKIHQWHWEFPSEKSRLHHPPCSRAWTLAGCNLVLSRCIMVVFVHLTLYIYCLRDVRVARCGHVTWPLQRWSVTSLKCVMQLGRVITRNWFTAKWPLFS